MKLTLLFSLLLPSVALAANHAGNVFVAGEDVQVNIPAAWPGWRAVDIDGKEVGRGARTDQPVQLGKLPIGYFEIGQRASKKRITAAVVAKNSPSPDTPIALDAGMAWFYPEPQ